MDANDRDPEAVLRRDRPDDRQAVGGPVVQTAQGLAHPAVAWAYRTAAPTYRFRTEAADGRGGLVVVSEQVGSSGSPWRLEVSDATSPKEDTG